MKNKTAQMVTVHHTAGQKVFGILGFVALFACGIMVGVAINGTNKSNRVVKEIGMTESQCAQIAQRIVLVGDSAEFDVASREANAKKLRELNDVYTKNCAGRTFEVEEPKPVPKAENTADKKTCEVIEDMLSHRLAPETEVSPDLHQNNIETYKKMIANGCPENAEKYQALIKREQDILMALIGDTVSGDTQTCMEIERVLLARLPDADQYSDGETRIERAKIYANISERGCPENSQYYVDMAAKELEIARALRDDNFNNQETEEVVETYRRLKMKQAAGEILNKVQQLTDPAIDFIIQAQKIIEE